MSMNEILIQAMNISSKFSNVKTVECNKEDNIQIVFDNSVGRRYLVIYDINVVKRYPDIYGFIRLVKRKYEKSIRIIYDYNLDVRYSSLDYSQEELEKKLKEVNI